MENPRHSQTGQDQERRRQAVGPDAQVAEKVGRPLVLAFHHVGVEDGAVPPAQLFEQGAVRPDQVHQLADRQVLGGGRGGFGPALG